MKFIFHDGIIVIQIISTYVIDDLVEKEVELGSGTLTTNADITMSSSEVTNNTNTTSSSLTTSLEDNEEKDPTYQLPSTQSSDYENDYESSLSSGDRHVLAIRQTRHCLGAQEILGRIGA